MGPDSFRFDGFVLDPGNRRLTRAGVPVELNARYLDALALLVRESGALVSKDRFLSHVWAGVPVTDEALTQCIRTLRRTLGDDAARPRFIETVPKHGYRFVAPVASAGEPGATAVSKPPQQAGWGTIARESGAGALGGGLAGMLGGLIYGIAAAPAPFQPGMGAGSVLLVLLCVTGAVGAAGGAGVGAGIGAGALVSRAGWLARGLGGAAGGLMVGGFANLLAVTAFALLGRAPGAITGAAEGGWLGLAIGLAGRGGAELRLRHGTALAVLAGGAAGALIPLFGGRLMGGSIDQLTHAFAASALRLDRINALLGEPAFGPLSQIVTAALEGALFGGSVVAAILLARRRADQAALRAPR